MSLPIPIRPPGRRQRRRLVAVVATAALAGAFLTPNALASVARPQDQSKPFYSWGTDYNGQIGNGTFTDEFTPQAITLPGGVTPVQASVGYQFDLMLGSDGHI